MEIPIEIPTDTAKRLRPDLTDLVGRSHMYKQIKEISNKYIEFEIPFKDDITWTDIFIGRTGDHISTAVTLCLAIEGQPRVHALTEELAAPNRLWRPLPWALPSIPLNGHKFLLRLNMGYIETEVIIIKLLGFQGLLEKKGRYVFVDRQGQYLVSLSNDELSKHDTSGMILPPLAYHLE